jgi:hypothetical protein
METSSAWSHTCQHLKEFLEQGREGILEQRERQQRQQRQQRGDGP